MGPYCKYCDTRCFVHLPEHTPAHVIQAYHQKGFMSPIIATCKRGQAFEQDRIGWCYDTIKAGIEATTQTFTRSGGTLTLTPSAFTLDLTASPVPHIALFQLANQLEQHTGMWLDLREAPNGGFTEWMVMDKHGNIHQATGTPRTVTIPLA